MANVMAPYYRLLANRAATDPAAVGEFFVASQLQIRPGVADTQAVLARELSSGSDDGARLLDRKSGVAGKRVSVRVGHGVRRRLKKKNKIYKGYTRVLMNTNV